MKRKTIILQLTDIKFHATKSRPTTSIVKAMDNAEKKGEAVPRIFAPLPKKGGPGGLIIDPKRGVGIPLTSVIPQEVLKDAYENGYDIGIQLPDGNAIHMSLAPDVEEKTKKIAKQKRTELIHRTKMREQRYKKYNRK